MLHLHRSERADALVPALAALLADPLDDAFAPEVIAVPTQGVERWVAQRLSHVLGAADGEAGVCANVTFPPPGRLVAQALAEALGSVPENDPWAPQRLAWVVLDVVDAVRDEPWCAVVDRYLSPGPEGRVRDRRLALARRLADLFTGYGAQRPDLVTAWAAGSLAAPDGPPPPPDLLWQVELWRRVREAAGTPSPAERLATAVDALRADGSRSSLPQRISVLGATRLPEAELRVLRALAAHRDVHLWLVHPSPALWEKVSGEVLPPRRRDRRPVARHPLLASMAADVTELQTRLGAADRDTHHPAPEPPPSLLGALQRHLRADRRGEPPSQVLADGDRSVEVHACHGRARQVEVLRELLVGLFQADPTLEPRDVVVMCPDVESIAPLVAATFGAADTVDPEPDGAAHPGQRLRVRLADRSLRRTNPLLALASRLLDLADGRVTASEVLDLAASAPVRRRFAFTDDDLERLRTWAVDAGAHWGEDGRRRVRFGLDARVRQGTWDAVLDRLLLGVAMADEDHRFVGSALPLDDVDSTSAALAGRFAEFLDRLTAVLERLDGRHPAQAWLDALQDGIVLLGDSEQGQAWQQVQAGAVLAEVGGQARGAAAALGLGDVRALLADRLAGRPTRAGFRTGALTVCSLEPMRAVPHRVVCLLGLDDGGFPRGQGTDGDDWLLRDPCAGERDRRSEDRQLFLDAVTSAGERLVVLYSGADERTGALRPPAVPVAELLDALEDVAVVADGRTVRERVVVRHPLQPVDERYFTAPDPFSFDAVAFGACRVGREPRAPAPPFLDRLLPVLPATDEVDLADLVDFLEHPVRWFLKRRLELTVLTEIDDLDDRLPLELQPLDRWAVGDRLLTACLAGADRDSAFHAEWRRGSVPPRELGRRVLGELVDQVTPIATMLQRTTTGPDEVVDVQADLPSTQVTLTGSVAGIRSGPKGRPTVSRALFSKLGPKHRLRAWVQVLALAATHQDRPWQAVTVGRGPGRSPAATSLLTAPDPVLAARVLDDLVRLRSHAQREPLPLPPAASTAYARSRTAGETAEQALSAAQRQWEYTYEREDRYHVLVWGPGAKLTAFAGTPTATEAKWSPDGTDTTRLGVLALRVWRPLLAQETLL